MATARILIVEDEAIVAKAMSNLSRRLDCRLWYPTS